eukprot:13502390-Alexandrium_andersonii.AAC.1
MVRRRGTRYHGVGATGAMRMARACSASRRCAGRMVGRRCRKGAMYLGAVLRACGQGAPASASRAMANSKCHC